MNAAGWAALWFADVEILRSCAQCDTMQNWIIAELLSTDNRNFPRMLLDCVLLLMEARLMDLLTIFCREGRAYI